MRLLAGTLLIVSMTMLQTARPPVAPLATVSCDVSVVGPDGLPLEGLSLSDFQVLSDGEPVTAMGLSAVPAALSVILVVDATTSQPLRRYEINNALATYWLPGLRPGDKVRVGTLGTPLTLTSWLPDDQRAALAIVRPLVERAPIEPSPLWDAATSAIQSLAGETGTRLVVLLTDGRANANRVSLDDVGDAALSANVIVSSVSEGGERVLAQAGEAVARVRSDASLQWLADQTGGVFLADGVARRTMRAQVDPFAYVRELVQTPNQPGPLLARILTVARHRYRLSFAGLTDGRIHRLDVRVGIPGASVSVKKRYLAGQISR